MTPTTDSSSAGLPLSLNDPGQTLRSGPHSEERHPMTGTSSQHRGRLGVAFAFHGIGHSIAESRLRTWRKTSPEFEHGRSIHGNKSDSRSFWKLAFSSRPVVDDRDQNVFRKWSAENRGFPIAGREDQIRIPVARSPALSQLGIRLGTRKDKGLGLWVPPLQRDNLWL